MNLKILILLFSLSSNPVAAQNCKDKIRVLFNRSFASQYIKKINRVKHDYSVGDIGNILSELTPEMIQVFQRIKRGSFNYDWYDHVRVDDDLYTCPLCAGASLFLLKKLKNSKVSNLKIEHVETFDSISNGKILFFHETIRIRSFFASGEDLIIDPTIRQFFFKHMTEERLDLIPKIFIGTEVDMKNLLLTHFSLLDRNVLKLDNYFDVKNIGDKYKYLLNSFNR